MTKEQALDLLERVLWTLVQGATAVGIVAGYNALEGLPDLPPGYEALAVPVIAAVLAVIKGSLATKFGNGSASTLPADVEPVPADVAAALEQGAIETETDEDDEDDESQPEVEGSDVDPALLSGEVTSHIETDRDRDPVTGRFI